MISPARKLAYKLLCRIESQRLFSDDAVNSPDMDKLEMRDRRLATEIVYGTLRWQESLDYVLAKLSSRPWKEVTPQARVLLRMSLYQLWRMDRVPDHALVNDAVELAKRELGKGIDRYLNGILRHLTRTRPWEDANCLRQAPPWVRVSLPQWLWERWRRRFGESAAGEYALSLNEHPQVAFRFTGKSGGPEMLPSEAAISDIVPEAFIRKTVAREEGSSALDQESIHFQDEASQLIPCLLGPMESEWRVWDVCAAPGGKSAILSRAMPRPESLISSDISRDRTERLIRVLKESGDESPSVVVADACKAPFRSCFDAVLADVPCSGLGTLRRNPEIKWHFRPEELKLLQKTQTQILQSVAEAVRPGGRLLYSTCSTEPEENEQVIQSFLETRSDFRLERPVHPPGIERWVCEDGMVRTFPGTRLWDGFFAALMVRTVPT